VAFGVIGDLGPTYLSTSRIGGFMREGESTSVCKDRFLEIVVRQNVWPVAIFSKF
jgi:hypothetical protein